MKEETHVKIMAAISLDETIAEETARSILRTLAILSPVTASTPALTPVRPPVVVTPIAPAPAAKRELSPTPPHAEAQPVEFLPTGAALTHRCGARSKADAFRVWKALSRTVPWFNDPVGLERMARSGVRAPMNIARPAQWFTDKIQILTGAGLAERRGRSVYRVETDDDTAFALLRETHVEHGKKVRE